MTADTPRSDGDRSPDDSDGDTLLNIIGIVLAVALLVGLGTMILTAMNAPYETTDKPAVNWTLERVNDTHARLTHAGGDTVVAENLILTVNGSARRVSWGGTEHLTQGATGTAQVPPNGAVRLYWTSGTADRVLLAEWQTG